jgi:hypothetical protein
MYRIGINTSTYRKKKEDCRFLFKALLHPLGMWG